MLLPQLLLMYDMKKVSNLWLSNSLRLCSPASKFGFLGFIPLPVNSAGGYFRSAAAMMSPPPASLQLVSMMIRLSEAAGRRS